MTENNAKREQELIAILKQLLAESHESFTREVRVDASFSRHLNLDSLGRAELFRRIEKDLQVSLPDSLLREADTLNDILDYLHHASPSSKKTRTLGHRAHDQSPQVNVPDVETLIQVLQYYGKAVPEKAHIYFQNEEGREEVITFGMLYDAAREVALGLQNLGLQEGETVAIMQPTHPAFFYTFFGVLFAGGIPVPIYPPFRMHMLETYAKLESRILRNAEVRVLVTFEQAEKLSHLLKAFVPSLKHVVTIQELMQGDKIAQPFKANAQSFAFIQYTSGSTSDPKGVLLNHFNLLTNIKAYGKAIQVTPRDVTVSWLPLYHDMGLIGMWLGSLYFGIPLVLLTPFSFLNHPERWLWAIHYHRGTLSGAPNFAYELCARKIDESLLEGLDLSSWRLAANGAEKIYPRTLKQFIEKFKPYGFKPEILMPVYGLAESTVALTIPPLNRGVKIDSVDRKAFEEDRVAKATSEKNAIEFVGCGMPIENHEIRIVDEHGKVLADRQVGSLQFRGPSSMQGYYHNPQATNAVVQDGWIDSGDLAYIVANEAFITGRRKDLIIKAGRNLYPAEIEELVGGIKGIRQGCVAAFSDVDHDRGTEQLIVVAETREEDKKNRANIIKNIQTALSEALDLVADKIILVPPHIVPKTSSGKLQRSACKNLYLTGRLTKAPVPAWLQMTKLALKGVLKNVGNALIQVAKFFYTLYVALLLIITFLPVYLIVAFSNQKFAAKVMRAWARSLPLLCFCPMKIVGRENLTKAKPLVYAANHASYIDAIVALAVTPAGTRFIGKKELLNAPVIRTLIRKLDFLPIDRMDLPKGLEDTKHIENALKTGDSILIFPEGTFGYASGLRPFRMGTFILAAETNTPICPIAIAGTRKILRDDEKLLRPNRIKVTVCELIEPNGSEWKDMIALRNKVRLEIAKYCGEPTLDLIAPQTVAPKLPK